MTFTDWLRKQTRRRDAVGDLARDTRADLHWPPPGKPSRSRYRGYLVQLGAIPAALDALDLAWEEWDAQRRAGKP
ncbi:MAG: hypothetical protein WDA60_05515 [Acidimicrobiia bacterium]